MYSILYTIKKKITRIITTHKMLFINWWLTRRLTNYDYYLSNIIFCYFIMLLNARDL